jgi:hypothetical protein
VIDGAPFEEGTNVTVIAASDAGTFDLAPEDEAVILAAIMEADHGKLVEGVGLIAKLSSLD